MPCFPSSASGGTRRRPRLSGGQQQMCAIGRALMSNPDFILFDEISLGLAPVVIKEIYAALPDDHRGRRRARSSSSRTSPARSPSPIASSACRRAACRCKAARPTSTAPPSPPPISAREPTPWSGSTSSSRASSSAGVYALFAAGLSLIFGVMRLVNIAHGDFIVLAGFLALVVLQTAGIGPLDCARRRRPADGRSRLRPAARPPQPHPRQGRAAAAPRHLRPVGDHPERAPRGVHRRQPAAQCRADRGGELCRRRRHRHRRPAFGHVPRRGGGDRRARSSSSTARRSAAPSAPPPTIARSPA